MKQVLNNENVKYHITEWSAADTHPGSFFVEFIHTSAQPNSILHNTALRDRVGAVICGAWIQAEPQKEWIIGVSDI
jgi:hypothetical protein